MNKKFISLLLISPVVCSCHGATISKDRAKEIVSNLSTYLSELDYEKYPVECFVRKREEFNGISKVITKSIYSMNKMFYYTYSINYPVDGSQVIAKEKWIYGWTSQDDYNIYRIFRDNGGDYVPFTGEESMETKYSSLNEFNIAWGEIDKEIKAKTVVSDSINVVDRLSEIISYIEGDDIAVKYKFMSSNNSSLYYEGNYDYVSNEFVNDEIVHRYEKYELLDNLIESFEYIVENNDKSQNNYIKYTYNYNVPEIIYPKIN